MSNTGVPQSFEVTFLEACRILAYLVGRKRIGLVELREATNYPKSYRSLQKLLTKLQSVSAGQLKHDGCSPRAWWVEGDLNTFMKNLLESQTITQNTQKP
jgi:hypothetical protein